MLKKFILDLTILSLIQKKSGKNVSYFIQIKKINVHFRP